MTTIQDISTAVYRILSGDGELIGRAGVYKGPRRPSRATNPSLTIEVRRLERGEGEGIWMCDIALTAYGDLLANGTPDVEILEGILSRTGELLADAELELAGAKALPLIEGESDGPVWNSAHAGEAYRERVFGLVFVCFR